MAKVDREAIVNEALDLLDEVGLDEVSTRRLAKRLGIEQPSLYWHFPNKAALLTAMADAAMATFATAPLPAPSDDWRDWLRDNSHGFRHALLAHRDGARLHAGTSPRGTALSRALHKVAFLVAAGLPEKDAQMAMLAISHYTVGSVLEEQAGSDDADHVPELAGVPDPDPASAFDDGLTLIIDSLVHRARPAPARRR